MDETVSQSGSSECNSTAVRVHPLLACGMTATRDALTTLQWQSWDDRALVLVCAVLQSVPNFFYFFLTSSNRRTSRLPRIFPCASQIPGGQFRRAVSYVNAIRQSLLAIQWMAL